MYLSHSSNPHPRKLKESDDSILVDAPTVEKDILKGRGKAVTRSKLNTTKVPEAMSIKVVVDIYIHVSIYVYNSRLQRQLEAAQL